MSYQTTLTCAEAAHWEPAWKRPKAAASYASWRPVGADGTRHAPPGWNCWPSGGTRQRGTEREIAADKAFVPGQGTLFGPIDLDPAAAANGETR